MTTFKITVDKDWMSATIKFMAEGGKLLKIEFLEEELNELGIVNGLNTQLIASIDTDPGSFEADHQELVIAKGMKPLRGKDGKIDYKVSTKREFKAALGEGDRVDYKESMQVESVKKGQLLCEISMPGAGKPGKNIKGEVAPAADGREAKLKPGKNVESRGGNFHAQCDGMIVSVGDLLSVSAIYEVSGDVDMETGNIRFKGNVVIRGDVNDGFTIEADGDVVIGGVVGSANIKATGNVEIMGGVNGRNEGVITAGGEVSAKYLSKATVIADESVTVGREINNSDVKTLGGISILNGAIVGGTCMALKAVEAGYTGSELGVRTVVSLGEHYKVAEIEAKILAIEKLFDEMKKKSGPFVDQPKKFEALNAERKTELRELYKKFKVLKADWALLNRAKQEFAKQLNDRDPVIRIRKTLHADTVIRTRLCMRSFNDTLNGPFGLEEDVGTSTMIISQK